ncbi:MAG: PAS domain-containing sensor histidine kinase [Tannerella sp.]|jgi:nitrogen fixation/metabolism regulation signal transduction histidine kinase|nr:PAS domain-containing sensor histidine kinase [Tannerella sp.]
MKIDTLFRILGFVLVAAMAAIAFFTFRTENFYLSLGVEALTVFTVIYLLFFHRRIIKPLQIIGDGMDLLNEQDFSSRLRLVGQPETDRIIMIFNKMTDCLKNERLHVREQNHFLDLLINASPLGVLILDFDDRIFSVNRAAATLPGLGLSAEAIGRKLTEMDIPLMKELGNIEPYRSHTVRLSDASVYKCTHGKFIDRGFQRSFYLIELLTEEVFSAERKAYGQVIRMIAHEVNNTTAGITSTLGALEQMTVENDVQEALKVSIERCYRMNRFIANYADVVRIPEPQTRRMSLNGLVVSCKRFMENICRNRHIEIVMEPDEVSPVVEIDPVLFEQVMVNIIKNAAESIGTDGYIYIRTASSPVSLEIADTGKGISRETEGKLFSPFFSTKPNGQGLGLIFIREVLLKHGCTFSLHTSVDGLTRFRIFFQ